MIFIKNSLKKIDPGFLLKFYFCSNFNVSKDFMEKIKNKALISQNTEESIKTMHYLKVNDYYYLDLLEKIMNTFEEQNSEEFLKSLNKISSDKNFISEFSQEFLKKKIEKLIENYKNFSNENKNLLLNILSKNYEFCLNRNLFGKLIKEIDFSLITNEIKLCKLLEIAKFFNFDIFNMKTKKDLIEFLNKNKTNYDIKTKILFISDFPEDLQIIYANETFIKINENIENQEKIILFIKNLLKIKKNLKIDFLQIIQKIISFHNKSLKIELFLFLSLLIINKGLIGNRKIIEKIDFFFRLSK